MRRRKGAALGFQEPVEQMFDRHRRVGDTFEGQLEQFPSAEVSGRLIWIGHVKASDSTASCKT